MISDHLGWPLPIVVTAKIFMQQLWPDEIDWDDPLKLLTLLKWMNFVSNCKGTEEIRIPRWLNFSPNCKIELHAFFDSSEAAYDATLFIRIEIEIVFTRICLWQNLKLLLQKRCRYCGWNYAVLFC